MAGKKTLVLDDALEALNIDDVLVGIQLIYARITVLEHLVAKIAHQLEKEIAGNAATHVSR